MKKKSFKKKFIVPVILIVVIFVNFFSGCVYIQQPGPVKTWPADIDQRISGQWDTTRLVFKFVYKCSGEVLDIRHSDNIKLMSVDDPFYTDFVGKYFGMRDTIFHQVLNNIECIGELDMLNE